MTKAMKNMDNFWEKAEKSFQKQLDNRKTILFGYAISFICIALAILSVCLTVWRHREFSGKTLEVPVAFSIFGIVGFVFCFFRKRASIRVKFYTACLLMAIFSAYVLIFHPEAATRRYPYPELNRAIDFAGIAFFGGAGLWVLCNDIMWHLRRKPKNKLSQTPRKLRPMQEKLHRT